MLLNDQKIKALPDDAEDFILLLNKILGTLVWQYRVKEIRIVKIKNWFDHKWLNFSGKAIIPFKEGVLTEYSFEEKWQDKVTVPPFHPRRVLSETFFRKKPTNNETFEKRLHTGKNSIDNLHNRITDKTKDGLFLWYSSETKINAKGSLMVYIVQENYVHTFYAGLADHNGQWQVMKTKGIELNELKLMTSDKRA
ncbi:MAG: hypothetical protein K0S32_4572 [Bacteroidetes bacterium]|jgi:hypothetical protein|nr:hypothetical protein [Bacteroidota bacterium]